MEAAVRAALAGPVFERLPSPAGFEEEADEEVFEYVRRPRRQREEETADV